MSDGWEDVDPGLPLLLLPLRVETQSAGTRAAPVLRVRIYPDDVAIDREHGRALLLPDRFRVVVRQGDMTSETLGEPVDLDALGLGQAGTALDELADALRGVSDRSGDAAWLGDIGQARDRGLAVEVPLLGGTARITSLLVMGVRTQRDPEQETREVLAALACHGPDAAFVTAGTPTNNTEWARSTWHRADEASPEEVLAGTETQPTAHERLLAALGATGPSDGDTSLVGWPGADARDDAAARAMATALWPVTWDVWLTRTLRPGILSADDRARLRQHAVDHVRGRGVLPMLQLGRQPYGVLPVTDPHTLRGEDRLEVGLGGVLSRAWQLWKVGSGRVPMVTSGDLRTALPEILGQEPVSWGLRTRRVLGTGGTLASTLTDGSYEQAESRAGLARVLQALIAGRPVFGPPDLLGVDRTLGVPLVADSDPAALRRLVEDPGGTPGGASVLQIMLGLAVDVTRAAWEAALDGMGELPGQAAAHQEALSRLVGDDAATEATRVLEELRETRELGPDVGGALKLLEAGRREHATSHATGFGLRLPLADVFGPALRRNASDASAVLAHMLTVLRATQAWSEVQDAVLILSEVDKLEERRGLLAEALDCTSHRYDAWVTSLATRRLAALRNTKNKRTGIVVGAFGWLEDIELRELPETEPDPDVDAEPRTPRRTGVVHAPSMAHAATAAVLRGARLAHAAQGEAHRALAVDLSSTRTREALRVLDGMRAGHELGALLGHQLERWLHEADPALNRFVPGLRSLAPTVMAKEVDRVSSGEVGVELEAPSIAQVVDGVRLIDLRGDPDTRAAKEAGIRSRLGTAPAGARYPMPEWRPPSGDEWQLVLTCLDRLEELLDAVGDLLLAEGVHQFVSGNPSRAAAAMDALSGDALPPAPDVTASVPDRIGTINRVAVLLPAQHRAAPSRGWAESPRARANPALEAWCRGVLGPATHIAVAAVGNGSYRRLSSLTVAALDLVVVAGASGAADGSPDPPPPLGLREFWDRAGRTTRGLPPTPLLERPPRMPAGQLCLGEAWRVAAVLHDLLAGGRPLAAADLVHDLAGSTDGDPPELGRETDVGELRSRYCALAADLTALVPAPDEAAPDDLVALADSLSAFGIGTGVDPAALSDVVDESADHVEGEDPPRSPLRRYVDSLTAQAGARLASAHGLATEGDHRLADAISTLFGDELPVLPILGPAAAGDVFAAAWSSPSSDDDPAGVRPWLTRHTMVRAPLRPFLDSLMIRSALAHPARLRAVTLRSPRREGGPTEPDPADQSRSYLVVEVGAGADPMAGVAGVVVDSWTEATPRRRRLDGEDKEMDLTTTGLAVHANGPDARPPQALLLAVSPDREPWTWEKVAGVLDATRALARMRLVTLERAPLVGSLLPAAYVSHWSLQGERVINPELLTPLAADASTIPRFVRFEEV